MEDLFTWDTTLVVLRIIIATASLYMTFNFLRNGVKEHSASLAWKVWRRWHPKMAVELLPVIFLTLTTGYLLSQVPGLNMGWMNLFFEGGGNVLFAPITLFGELKPNEQPAEELSTTQIWVAKIIAIAIVGVMLGGLAYFFPFAAWYEEKIFREGRQEWPSIIKASVVFGLIHLLVGIPVAMGLALIWPGLFFGYKYRCASQAIEKKILNSIEDLRTNRDKMSDEEFFSTWARLDALSKEPVMESTAYHALYNTMILVGIFVLGVAMICTK